MRIIGITGGIGTGKSTVLGILENEYNAYIIETDKLAHELMLPDRTAYLEIVKVFGDSILNEDRTIHRGKLGQIVFQDKVLLTQLNQIVHPAVKQYILNDIKRRQDEQSVEYYVIEAALLIEDGYKAICDELWYVYSSQDTRIQRLLESRGGNCEKWMKVIANQSSDAFYKTFCDVTIDNGQSIEKTTLQIKELLCK